MSLSDLLNGGARGSGAGPASVTLFRNGKFTETIINNVPGTLQNNAEGIMVNPVGVIGPHFHSQLTEQWVTAVNSNLPAPTWTVINTRLTTNTARGGFAFCLTDAGPGIVSAWVNTDNSNRTRVGRWDVLTETATFFDQPSGSTYATVHPIANLLVVGNLLYIHGYDAINRTQVFNLETGSFTEDTITGSTNRVAYLGTVNGNIYAPGRKSATGTLVFNIFLGGSWIEAIDTGIGIDTATQQDTVYGCWSREGKLYATANRSNGSVFVEYDPNTGGVTDLTTTGLDPLVQPGGGLGGVTTDNRWSWSNYIDDLDPANPRYMVQLATDLSNQSGGVLLFEHTDAGLVFQSGTELNVGTNALNYAPASSAGITWANSNLWGYQVEKPVSERDGVRLKFRFGGDPGNADTILRLYYAGPLAAVENRAVLTSPSTGLGTAAATLFEEAPGVWRVDNWDADGVTDLTVLHPTNSASPNPNGFQTAWVFNATKP